MMVGASWLLYPRLIEKLDSVLATCHARHDVNVQYVRHLVCKKVEENEK
jgi:hypothetical protein